MFPLLLNLAGRACVVVGGGDVGRRKAAAIVAAGGSARLVCPEPCPFAPAHEALEWVQEAYEPRHLEGACLVFAAATPDVNARVTEDAHARGLWVNRADQPDEGDFILPAVLRRGEVTVAVGTGGAAPGVAQAIRDRLETHVDEAVGAWAAVLAELRPEILQRIDDPERRREVFAELCRWEWLERVRRLGSTVTAAAMRASIEHRCAADSERL